MEQAERQGSIIRFYHSAAWHNLYQTVKIRVSDRPGRFSFVESPVFNLPEHLIGYFGHVDKCLIIIKCIEINRFIDRSLDIIDFEERKKETDIIEYKYRPNL